MDTGTIDAGIWKSATGKGRKTPKGRQASDTAITGASIAWRIPRERHLLIEFLHLIQDHHKHPSVVMAALAEELCLSQIEAYEVAMTRVLAVARMRRRQL